LLAVTPKAVEEFSSLYQSHSQWGVFSPLVEKLKVTFPPKTDHIEEYEALNSSLHSMFGSLERLKGHPSEEEGTDAILKFLSKVDNDSDPHAQMAFLWLSKLSQEPEAPFEKRTEKDKEKDKEKEKEKEKEKAKAKAKAKAKMKDKEKEKASMDQFDESDSDENLERQPTFGKQFTSPCHLISFSDPF